MFLEDVELVLERALREANRRAWEEARSRPIPSVKLEPINWESPVRQSFAEEASRYYLQVLFLHGQSIHDGGSPSPTRQKPGREGGSGSLPGSPPITPTLLWCGKVRRGCKSPTFAKVAFFSRNSGVVPFPEKGSRSYGPGCLPRGRGGHYPPRPSRPHLLNARSNLPTEIPRLEGGPAHP